MSAGVETLRGATPERRVSAQCRAEMGALFRLRPAGRSRRLFHDQFVRALTRGFRATAEAGRHVGQWRAWRYPAAGVNRTALKSLQRFQTSVSRRAPALRYPNAGHVMVKCGGHQFNRERQDSGPTDGSPAPTRSPLLANVRADQLRRPHALLGVDDQRS